MIEKIKEIDNLFESYNYTLSSRSNNKVRIYTLRYGMYHAAEFILLDSSYDTTVVRKEFSDLGYATEVKEYKEEQDFEEYLFKGFFIDTPLGRELKNRYKNFEKRQVQNLPQGSTYQYINSAYDLLYNDKDGSLVEAKSYSGAQGDTLIDKINNSINSISGALLVIIEAPAGFGKTCTAHEILNTFSPHENNKLPFFTELSRNREARIFKHILLNEIDQQFPNGIKQNVVLEQIYKGRIPLIIDGFDELISKESNKDEVESMLSTIVDLLKEEAKIIITSRKTAIFNSENFLNLVYDANNNFSHIRFEIKEPTIENWLSSERIEMINSKSFPIERISNPVLLAYLRNIPLETLGDYLKDANGTLLDKYFDYLLIREQERQNIKLDKETQLRIFRKLNRLMCEFNISAETKGTIKEFIKEFNLNILQESLKNYIPEERPSVEDLVDTLSNHVFLDRRTNGDIGFANDFIFGVLVGENLIYNKFQEHYSEDFVKVIPQDFALKSIESFNIQGSENKVKLWEIFNENDFQYDINFYFELDYSLLRQVKRKYKNLFISDRTISNVNFGIEAFFDEGMFSGVEFRSCTFDINQFKSTTFQNCNFFNCNILINDSLAILFNDFALFTCKSNNTFIDDAYRLFANKEESEKSKSKRLTDIEVLRLFFQVDGFRPRARKFSHVRECLNDFSDREVNKILESLKSKEYLHFKDDVGFITREAITYYMKNK